MRISRTILFPLLVTTAILAQSEDTGTAHKAAATALLNSNNRGAARLACPATIGPEPTANSPAGPGRAGGPPPGRGAAKGRGRGPGTPPPKENWYAEGGQVFDNLYMLTTQMNSAWAVKTSEGIILIDTLFGYAAQDAIVDGLKKAGLDPADIKYIVVSHAHGDHDGSVKFLQDTYNPRIIMGPKDWELAAREAESTPPRYRGHRRAEVDLGGYHGHDLHHSRPHRRDAFRTGSSEGSRPAAHGNGVGWDGVERGDVEGNAGVLHLQCKTIEGHQRRRGRRRDHRQPHRIQRRAGPISTDQGA